MWLLNDITVASRALQPAECPAQPCPSQPQHPEDARETDPGANGGRARSRRPGCEGQREGSTPVRALRFISPNFPHFFPILSKWKAEQMTTIFQLLNNKVEIFFSPFLSLSPHNRAESGARTLPWLGRGKTQNVKPYEPPPAPRTSPRGVGCHQQASGTGSGGQSRVLSAEL